MCLSADFLNKRLGGILEIYETFVGDDPRKLPMKIFPGMHYSMGGLWVDYNLMTSIPGLFAGGECNYEYHGANRLGANALLSCTFDGLKGAPKILEYCKGLKKRSADVPDTVFTSEHRRMRDKLDDINHMDGPENVFKLHQILGEAMTNNVTVVRNNKDLAATLELIKELKARATKIGLHSKNRVYNQEFLFINHFSGMLALAELITLAALQRDESRGAHYKPAFPERLDEKFLKTTIGKWAATGPQLSYAPVDTRFIKPRMRVYNVDKNVSSKGAAASQSNQASA